MTLEQSPAFAEPVAWAVRGAFVPLLDRLGISLVLSTRPNHIVFLGAHDSALTASTTLVAQPMGLAANPGRIAVASARTITIFANVPRLAPHYPGRPDYYDAFFIPRTLYFTGECSMHDMVFEGQAVIGANTNFSCICRVDGSFSFTPLWTPSFITELRAEDRCHLNGFAGENGQLRYLTALSASNTPHGWREEPDHNGILIDAVKNTLLRADLCMPHSPRLFGDQLYVLNGGEGEILNIDRGTGESRVVASLPGFTHGLAEHSGVLFVGMSQNRVSRSKNPPPVGQRYETLIAGVAAVDARSGQILGSLEFGSGVTEVYDVQVLPGIRRAGMQNMLATDGVCGIDTPNTAIWTKRPENDMQHVADIAGSGQYTLKVKPA